MADEYYIDGAARDYAERIELPVNAKASPVPSRAMNMELFDEMPVGPMLAHPNNPRWIGHVENVDLFFEPDPDRANLLNRFAGASETLERPLSGVGPHVLTHGSSGKVALCGGPGCCRLCGPAELEIPMSSDRANEIAEIMGVPPFDARAFALQEMVGDEGARVKHQLAAVEVGQQMRTRCGWPWEGRNIMLRASDPTVVLCAECWTGEKR